MFTRLIESRPTREKSAGAQVVSTVVHAAILGVAVYGTLGMSPPRTSPVLIETAIIYTPTRAASPMHRGGRPIAPPCSNPDCFQLPDPVRIPDPAVDLTADPVIDPSPVGGAVGPIGTPSGEVGATGTGGDDGGLYEIVERPAAPLQGNPRPSYPGILRSAHIEGTVSVRFVVDTSGRVEPASITVESSGERLFGESVRRALLASRFMPAETQGRRVRMLVRQDFAFRLTP